ncbi:hypothetical protein HDU76_007551, partial [Blyttiomyces sp. JEL0837]
MHHNIQQPKTHRRGLLSILGLVTTCTLLSLITKTQALPSRPVPSPWSTSSSSTSSSSTSTPSNIVEESIRKAEEFLEGLLQGNKNESSVLTKGTNGQEISGDDVEPSAEQLAGVCAGVPEAGMVCVGPRTFALCTIKIPIIHRKCAVGTICCPSTNFCDWDYKCPEYNFNVTSAKTTSSYSPSTKKGYVSASSSTINSRSKTSSTNKYPPSSITNIYSSTSSSKVYTSTSLTPTALGSVTTRSTTVLTTYSNSQSITDSSTYYVDSSITLTSDNWPGSSTLSLVYTPTSGTPTALGSDITRQTTPSYSSYDYGYTPSMVYTPSWVPTPIALGSDITRQATPSYSSYDYGFTPSIVYTPSWVPTPTALGSDITRQTTTRQTTPSYSSYDYSVYTTPTIVYTPTPSVLGSGTTRQFTPTSYSSYDIATPTSIYSSMDDYTTTLDTAEDYSYTTVTTTSTATVTTYLMKAITAGPTKSTSYRSFAMPPKPDEAMPLSILSYLSRQQLSTTTGISESYTTVTETVYSPPTDVTSVISPVSYEYMTPSSSWTPIYGAYTPSGYTTPSFTPIYQSIVATPTPKSDSKWLVPTTSWKISPPPGTPYTSTTTTTSPIALGSSTVRTSSQSYSRFAPVGPVIVPNLSSVLSDSPTDSPTDSVTNVDTGVATPGVDMTATSVTDVQSVVEAAAVITASPSSTVSVNDVDTFLGGIAAISTSTLDSGSPTISSSTMMGTASSSFDGEIGPTLTTSATLEPATIIPFGPVIRIDSTTTDTDSVVATSDVASLSTDGGVVFADTPTDLPPDGPQRTPFSAGSLIVPGVSSPSVVFADTLTDVPDVPTSTSVGSSVVGPGPGSESVVFADTLTDLPDVPTSTTVDTPSVPIVVISVPKSLSTVTAFEIVTVTATATSTSSMPTTSMDYSEAT